MQLFFASPKQFLFSIRYIWCRYDIVGSFGILVYDAPKYPSGIDVLCNDIILDRQFITVRE